ncbi:MAG: MFS transporter [Thermoplasmata archaeon]|nr:MFS transporter [Thermoplasmata archaeon]
MNIPVFRDIISFKKFSRDVKLLILSSLVLSFNMGFMYVDFPVYLSQVGYNAYIIGIILSLPTLVGALLMIPMGSLSDRYARKKFILISRAFSLIGGIIYFFTYQFYMIIIAGILQGIAFANVSSSYNALLAEKTDAGNRNVIFASNSFISGIFMAVGMIIGGLPPYIEEIYHLNIFNSYRYLFLMGILGYIISTVLIFYVHEDYKGSKKVRLVPEKSKKIIIKLSVLGLIGLGAGVIVRLFPYWFYLKYGINVNVLGPIFAISQIVTAFATMASPWIATKMGEIKTIVFTEAASVIILITMPLLPFYYLAGLFLITRNALMNMSGPIMTSFTMSIIPPEERALGSAIIQFFDAIPRSFGPALGGYFIYLGYLDLPFYFTGLLYSISIIMFYLFFKNVKIKRS